MWKLPEPNDGVKATFRVEMAPARAEATESHLQHLQTIERLDAALIVLSVAEQQEILARINMGFGRGPKHEIRRRRMD